MLQTVAGYDCTDPASVDAPVPDYLAGLGLGIKGLRIGFIRDLGAANDLLDSANRVAFENMVRVLKAEGAELVELSLPAPVSDYRDAMSVIGQTESMSIHEKDFLQHGDLMGQALRDKLTAGFFYRGVDYVNAQRRRRELAKSTDAMMKTVDAVVMPCAFHTAPKHGNDTVVRAFTSDTACTVFSISGHPAMSVCTGFDENGMPTNAQIAGRWLGEAMVLRVAHTFERATAFRATRPQF